jgi:hypothetical protein
LALVLTTAPCAGAATSVAFDVNTTADAHAANPAGGVCETEPGNGQCTLRAALEVTNNLPAGAAVTITVPAGHYVLSLGQLNLAPAADPTSVTIQGSGAATTILDGDHRSTVLAITLPFTALGVEAWPATIDGVTIQNGQGTGDPFAGVLGGGLSNDFGNLTLTNAIVTSNATSGRAMINGGGIANHGTLTLGNTTISNNSVTALTGPGELAGGGLSTAGFVKASRLTINGNSVNGGTEVGGAVAGGIANKGPITLSNATLTGNSVSNIVGSTRAALVGAGGLTNIAGFPTLPPTPQVVVSNVTVAANPIESSTGNTLAGGIAEARLNLDEQLATLALACSMVANNTGDCAGGLDDQGFNLDSDGSCGLSTANYDPLVTNPRLGPLQLNAPGGLETMALSAGSAAIDAANGCSGADERGVVRPQASACDMGAYEVIVVGRVRGTPVSQTFTPVADVDHLVQLTNRNPGVDNVRLEVNGKVIEVAGLRDGEQRTVDIASALQPGLTNTLVITTEGKPGGSAEIRIEP